MVQLRREKCVACRVDSPRVTDEEVTEFQPVIPEWTITSESGMPHLERTYKFDDFSKAMTFANGIGEAAEEEDHHPRLTVEWGRVNVAWWTHKIRGLHRNDFIMAAKSDVIFSQGS